MSARGKDPGAVAGKPKRRRWPRVLGSFAALSIIGIIVIAYFLQPTQLTALLLARASSALKLELHTTGSGNYALRPEPRLVLPGLSATIPGSNAPFFHSDKVEVALPWNTLRGRSTAISSIVLKSPDIDMPALQRWLATRLPSTTPFKFPTLTRGLQIKDGMLRGSSWRIEHLVVALPFLADGKPAKLDARGDLVRAAATSTFALTMTATPAGLGRGIRIDNAHLALKAEGELPSLSAAGSMRASDTFALDLTGAMQHVPSLWAKSIDSSFAKPGDTPFSIIASDGPPIPADGTAPVATVQNGLRLQLMLGDAKRQPALTLNGEESMRENLALALHGQLSRWPDAWPGLPPALGSNAAPIVFSASYQGSIFLSDPIVFDVKRADTTLQGRFHIADVRAWIGKKFDALLPPIEATLSVPLIDIGGMQLHGVQMDIRDDAPTQPAAKPPVVAPKS